MYAVVVYSPDKTQILKVCNLIEANMYLNTLTNKEEYKEYQDYFRENYVWYCKFNNTVRAIARDDSKIYAIVEIKESD